MIENPTVFVLGAGASIPYGLPSGVQLRNIICEAAAGISSNLSNSLSNHTGILRTDIHKFALEFQRSSQISIDSFLARRTEFAEIGKYCIAVELCQRENPDVLRQIPNDDDWYSLLWEALTRDASTVRDVRSNRVQFVTFNYDRSLEHFLFESTKYTYGVSDEDALTTVKSLGILHVYGVLGEFSPQLGENSRPYDTDLNGRKIQIAASGIRIIPEAREDDGVFHMARDMIARCKTLCFLGFGFDPLNLSRLDVHTALSYLNHRPQVVSSVFGKTDAEKNAYWLKVCGREQAWLAFNDTNSMTLRKSGILL